MRPTGFQEFRSGWPAIVAGLVGNMVFALPPYSIGVFMAPLHAAFGWSRTQVSFGLTLFTLVIGFSALVIGPLSDRFGPRRLAGGGYLAFAAGFAALAMMGASVSTYWLIMVLMAAFGAACSPVTLSRIVIDAFDTRRGLALGMTMMGAGLTALVAPLFLVPRVAEAGWRDGYAGVAMALAATTPVMFTALWFTRPSPRERGATNDMKAEIQPPDRRVFVGLFVAFLLVSLGAGGAVVHLVPMLGEAGLGQSMVALWAGLVGVAVVTARLLTGALVDRFPALKIAAGIMAAGALGFAVLSIAGRPALPLTAVVVGIALGAELDLVAYMTSRFFSASGYGKAFGGLYMAFQVGLAVSPTVYGALRNGAGDYRGALLFSAISLALAAIAFGRLAPLAARRPEPRQQ